MPARKKVEPVTTDLSSLLEFDEPATGESTEVENAPEVVEETPVPTVEQVELEALRAELAAIKARDAETAKSSGAVRPKPESELTPEERQIRQLQDELARVKGKNIDKIEDIFETGSEVILIHILADGFTAQGHVWYKGQEISFGPEAYKDTLDRYGESWLNLTEEEQWDRWDEVRFRKGPWPGKRSYDVKGLENVSITNKAPVVNVEG